MNEPNLQQEIQTKVLERILGGRAHMHSRTYFVVRVIAAAAVAALALAISAFVLSFIAFSIHESGEQFLLGFGNRGVATFFMLFPWVPLVADIAMLFLLQWLLQGFKFGYRFSLLSVFLCVLITSAVLAVAIDLSPIHRVLLSRADEGNLPVVGDMYESIRDSRQGLGVFRGTVMSMQNNKIVIAHNDGDHDLDDGTWTVTLPTSGRRPLVYIGERVYVFGSSAGQAVQAYGVEKLSPDQ